MKKESLAVTVGDKNIAEISEYSIIDLKKFMDELTLTDRQKQIGRLVLKEIRSRLGFLVDVGLDYLSLARATATLSGGEAQRIRLATQIGSGLVGVAYILDEPSIGLHQRDNDRLIATLKKLRDLGNTLIVVEHDEDTMREADYIVDIGPGSRKKWRTRGCVRYGRRFDESAGVDYRCLFKWEKADSCASKETQTNRLSESKRCQRK